MQESSFIENDFLNKVTGIVEENISSEQFGVSELANEIGMSRSNLLRKIKKLTGLSVSKFIRQVRLQRAMEMLKQTTLNVSEVSYQVGYSSVSYFIKCFGENYGYPPGEAGKKIVQENEPVQTDESKRKNWIVILGVIFSIVLLATIFFILINPFAFKQNDLEKSIAVLPFINDSNDSSNVHIINGLMESVLNNLQKIEDLRVISRTSVEKYRNNPKTISEISKELNANYLPTENVRIPVNKKTVLANKIVSLKDSAKIVCTIEENVPDCE
ncbi:MAG: helix-turn-helix domain-containing protein, partial [Prolixibacteraceae bacterium]|nr:helix-turn-helix domain-containing protein [Prolixibacteraceae bacterium]